MVDTLERTGPSAASESGARITSLVAEAAAAMDRRQPQIARRMSDLIMREVSTLAVDEPLLELMHASTDANVKTVIHVLINDIQLDRLQPTTAAVEYAVRLARRDIAGNSLVRAYSIGKDDFIEQMFIDVQALDCSANEKFEVLHRMSKTTGAYVDWITQYVFAVYEAERRRWLSSRGNVHASLVHEVLESREPTAEVFERETGYRLDRFHLGVVAWDAAPEVDDELRGVEQVIRRMATMSGASGVPLIAAIDRGTAWAWLPYPARPNSTKLAALRTAATQSGCRISVGLPGAGLSGFRLTHSQAIAARRVVGDRTDLDGAPIEYGADGVALTAILAQDLDATRRWVGEALGGLAVDDERTRALRETLRVFYLTGESYIETAARMTMHRNTVRYRVETALQKRNSDVSSSRSDLAAALTACHFLGGAVLTPPSAA